MGDACKITTINGAYVLDNGIIRLEDGLYIGRLDGISFEEVESRGKNQNLNFGQAIEALKDGKRVARSGWNGKGMWLAYVPHDAYALKSSIESPATSIGRLPWIGMKTADNKFVPWLASQTDVLAEDWQEVN